MNRTTILSSFFCLTLLGCETEFDVVVINNLDMPISVSIGSHTEVVAPGKLLRHRYPDVDGVEQSTVRIVTSQCKLSYRMGNELPVDYHWRSELRGYLPVEIGPDLNLYAVPPDATGPISIASVSAFQNGIFPVSPFQKECP